jgi:isoquinoline 1-oxidoreductase beta subunit
MNMTSTLGRRDFIKVTSTAGACLVLSFHLPWGEKLVALAQQSESPFSPNAWLRIDKDGTVTIIVARSEMGQGVRTALPMIVAEELDADWSKVKVEQALAEKKYDEMQTLGSTSVRTSWEKLRKAGATARAMLVTAAAQTWHVLESECRTENSTVIHIPTGRKLTYAELTETAAMLPVPDNVRLKDPKEFRIIGKRMPRVDTLSKVDGSAKFGIDIHMPGMLYASVVQCPIFGGKVKSYDETKAAAVPGVKKILKIDGGVAVVGDSTWAALQGREALQVVWDQGPNATLSSEQIRGRFIEAAKRPGAIAEKAGDCDAALSTAAKRLDAVYEVPFLAHATMEPMNCVADVRRDRCEIWAPTQDPRGFQRTASEITGLPEAKVIVHTTLLGGGFGRRHEPDVLAQAVQVSRAVGAPVKVTWTREDDMTHDWYRPASYHVLSGGLDKEGNLIAFKHKLVAPSITESKSPGSVWNAKRWLKQLYTELTGNLIGEDAVEGTVRLPYSIPHFRVEYVMANTPVPIGWWRSVYPSQNVFAVESFMDELAHAAGRDPFEFRSSLVTKMPRMKKAMQLAAEKARWGKPLRKGHALGIALSPPAYFVTPVVQIAEVSVGKGKRVKLHRVVCAIDCGIVVNPDSVEAQMEGGFVFGVTAALKGKITVKNGRVEQGNFDDYPLLTIDEMPVVETVIVESTEPPSGTGELGVPAAAPAVANAVFAATGQRVRTLPIKLS